jgi:hypothetical protein
VADRGCAALSIRAFLRQIETTAMQRNRAKAIAISQRQALQARLTVAAGLLLLPAALLLLLISP